MFPYTFVSSMMWKSSELDYRDDPSFTLKVQINTVVLLYNTTFLSVQRSTSHNMWIDWKRHGWRIHHKELQITTFRVKYFTGLSHPSWDAIISRTGLGRSDIMCNFVYFRLKWLLWKFITAVLFILMMPVESVYQFAWEIKATIKILSSYNESLQQGKIL